MVQAGPNVIFFDIDGTLLSAHSFSAHAQCGAGFLKSVTISCGSVLASTIDVMDKSKNRTSQSERPSSARCD